MTVRYTAFIELTRQVVDRCVFPKTATKSKTWIAVGAKIGDMGHDSHSDFSDLLDKQAPLPATRMAPSIRISIASIHPSIPTDRIGARVSACDFALSRWQVAQATW